MRSHKTISRMAGGPSRAVLLLAFCAWAHTQSNATMLGGVVDAEGAGTPEVPITRIHIVPTYDWSHLRRWGFGDDRLAPGNILMFQQSTLWELHKWRISAVFGLILVQTLLLAALLMERSRRRSATRRLVATFMLAASSEATRRIQAEERFRHFFDLPLVGMAITSPERSFLLVNQTLCNLLGYSAEELTGRTWLEVTHPEDVAESQWLFEQILAGAREGYLMDNRFIHRDGRLVYAGVSMRCMRRADGTVDHLFLIVQDITERKQTEEWLSQLTARLLKSQDEERRRIARELHDVTAQGIGLILLNLAYLKKATPQIDSLSKDKLAESIALGDQALREIRTLSYVLHPPLLDQAGLVTALQWYAKGFTERCGIRVDFTEDRPNGHRMPSDVEYSLFRVVQECLTNIRRHTTSDSASITLTRTEGEVVLQVRDHGTSLRLGAPTNGDGIESLGVGIPGMQHRLKQLGGELAVDSAANGTTVTATVPLRRVIYDSYSVGR